MHILMLLAAEQFSSSTINQKLLTEKDPLLLLGGRGWKFYSGIVATTHIAFVNLRSRFIWDYFLAASSSFIPSFSVYRSLWLSFSIYLPFYSSLFFSHPVYLFVSLPIVCLSNCQSISISFFSLSLFLYIHLTLWVFVRRFSRSSVLSLSLHLFLSCCYICFWSLSHSIYVLYFMSLVSLICFGSLYNFYLSFALSTHIFVFAFSVTLFKSSILWVWSP